MMIVRAWLSIAVGLSAAAATAQTLPKSAAPPVAGSAVVPAATAPPAATPAPPAVACDAACIRGNADRAVQACAPRVEAEAPGDYDWLFRPYGSLFQEADTPEQPTSFVVRYRGDSIRFLSPQREWVRAVYECGYDTAKQEVAYVRVRLGVLGKARAVPVIPTPAPQASAQKASPAQPAPNPAQAGANLAQTVAPTSDRRRVGELDDVSVLQVKPTSKQQ